VDAEIELIGVEELFRGLRFRVERRKYRFENREVIRDIVVFPESVAILPELDEEHIMLIKQYRPATGKHIYEVPAGVVEPGESVREAALRELEEELGYRAAELFEIGSFYLAPGYSTEKMHLFIARKLEYVGAQPEPYELIQPVVVSVNDLVTLIKTNTIEDMKTLAIILYYLAFIRRAL